MKKFWLLIIAILFFSVALLPFSSNNSEADEVINKIQIRTGHPMLGMVVSFIGGVQVEVGNNAFPSAQEETEPEKSPAHEYGILIDRKEALDDSFSDIDPENLHYLYNVIPVSRDSITSLYYDPAALPFIGQKVMKALSDISPGNYPYFQRRLAEFKSRLQSIVMVGRKMLENVPVFDLTGHSGYLFQAAGCNIEKKPDGFFEKLEEEESADYYTEIFSARQEKGVVVLGDNWTPEPIRNLMINEDLGVVLPAPDNKEEIILYLHKQLLSVWDKCRRN